MSSKEMQIDAVATGGSSLRDPPPTLAVIEAVSAAADVDPMELPPIGNVIDPDALNDLFHPTSNGDVTFEYAKFTVTVSADGIVLVTETR